MALALFSPQRNKQVVLISLPGSLYDSEWEKIKPHWIKPSPKEWLESRSLQFCNPSPSINKSSLACPTAIPSWQCDWHDHDLVISWCSRGEGLHKDADRQAYCFCIFSLSKEVQENEGGFHKWVILTLNVAPAEGHQLSRGFGNGSVYVIPSGGRLTRYRIPVSSPLQKKKKKGPMVFQFFPLIKSKCPPNNSR